MATVSNSPKNPDSEKSKRYDRQLRLWGENGQQALETSHVCLINATAVGTETLKSLVLPGIRAFTIIDEHQITEDDVDSNFFLCTGSQEHGSASPLGESRAKVAARHLLEMNADVKKGDVVEENFESLLDDQQSVLQAQQSLFFWANFSLVIATGIESERSLNRLSSHLWSLGVPLLVVKSLGYLGYLRLQLREHVVVETHPDSSLADLRLDAVWPQLKEYFDAFPTPLTSLSRKELSQVPALVIIYKGLLQWRKVCERDEQHAVPANYREKAQLKAILVEEMECFKEQEQLRSEAMDKKEEEEEDEEDETVIPAGPLHLDLENYEEAIKMLNSAFTDSRRIPAGVQKLLDEVVVAVAKSEEEDLNSQQTEGKPTQIQTSAGKNHHQHKQQRPKRSLSFWTMVRALAVFVEQYGTLPLAGTLPDMNAGSEQYVSLQRIYRSKAKADVQKLAVLVQQLAQPKQRQQLSSISASTTVSEAELALFCRNARFLTVIRAAGPMAEEMTSCSSKALKQLVSSPHFQNGAEDECNSGGGADELRYYLLMRLVERFHGKHNRYPGQQDDEVESDIAQMKREFRDLSNDLGCGSSIFLKDELIHEICRYGGCELHSISAFLGGCAAQEAVKIISGQYVPINNTFVYNGLTGTSTTYAL